MNRILSVARMQSIGLRSILAWPLVIMTLTFVINLALFSSIGDDLPDGPTTGGLLSVHVVALIFGSVTVTQYFPYALGMGVTRREFAAAFGVVTVVQALVYAAVLTPLAAVEDATGGWGVRMRFFTFQHLVPDGVFGRFAAYAVPVVLVTLIGGFFGVTHLRWRLHGFYLSAVGAIVLLAVPAVLVTWRSGWDEVGRWASGQPEVVLLAGWPLILVAALAAGGWAVLRRATV